MRNKKPLFKTGWILAVSIALLIFIPLTAYALAENITIESKTVSSDEPIKDPADLTDGELYVHTAASTSSDLTSTNFNISMSAIGQQYKVTTTTTQKYDIVFVLDVSNSMDDGNRVSNMVSAANDAIDTLTGDNNKIGIVSFATDSVIERALSTKPLDLSQTSSTYTGGATDIIKIGLRSNYYSGGTNIQSALNTAYGMLNAANDDAVPVIILLSDGAPTYYYSNLTNLSTGSTGRTGDGTQTSNNYSGYTIMQAAYLKTQMEDLQIYTIPFCMSSYDDYYNLEVATLNPTSANISAASGLSSTLNTIKSGLPAGVRDAISYQYADASYSATDSAQSLGSALTNIISNMLLKKPITETTVAGVLNNASYVTLTYTIGDAYQLVGDTMEVVLNNQNYNFDLYDGVYVYNPSTSSGTYKQALNNIVLTLSGNTVTWKIPASLLPCNTPEGAGQVLASPIELNFEVQLDESNADLTSGTYETNSSCTATFVPNTDDTFYYPDPTNLTSTTLATNTTSTTSQTTYYRAMYPYVSDGYYNASLPGLTGFGTGSASGSITYIASPSSVTVTGCTDYSGTFSDDLTVSYGGQSIPLDTVSLKTATANFTKNSSGQYVVSNFSDGISSFSDATVTATSGTNVTVSYDGGKRSVTFIGVPDISLAYTTAIFKSTSSSATTSRVSVKYFYPNGGSDVHSSCSVSSVTSTGGGNYTIVVRYNGLNYTFTGVTFTYVSYRNYTSSTKTANETGYSTESDSQQYYLTAGSKTVDATTFDQNYSLTYANGTLTVKTGTNGSLSNYAVHTQNANTTIVSDASGGYIVTETSSDGTSKTITHYAVNTAVVGSTSTSTLSVTSYTEAGSEWAVHSGFVNVSLENTGLLTLSVASLSGDAYITSATLKSLTGSDFTTATSSGQAYVVLTFTTTDSIKNLDITLGNTAEEDVSDFNYEITAAKTASGTSILTGGNLPTTLAAGTYKITFRTTITYPNASDKPETYYVNFDSLTFTLSSGTSNLNLNHVADYENQQVKVVLIPPLAH